jgi:hypothetical protein
MKQHHGPSHVGRILLLATLPLAVGLSGCGGGSDGSTTSTPSSPTQPPGGQTPTIVITASPAAINPGAGSTLTWSTTNATSCTASGTWSGSKNTSGTQSTGPLAASSTYTLTCSGVGGSANNSVTVAVSSGSGKSFATNFDLSENPISEGGVWNRANNSFTNVRTSDGTAYGTNGPANTFDDSYALLSGFGPDQTAEATVVRSSSLNTAVSHEVELLLRFSDDTSGARGYECLFSYQGGVQIVRWNGTMGDYTVLSMSGGPASIGRNFVTGDVIKATAIGNTISVYVNGVFMGQATDSTFPTGQPGISFFTRPGGNSAHFALSSYTVTSN